MPIPPARILTHLGPLLLTAHAAAQTAAQAAGQAIPAELPPDAKRQGWALFAVVALLGVTLILCAGLLMMLSARRRRKAKQRPIRPADPRDPWEESAKRMVEIEGPEPTE